jgi:hypothetical protein
MANGLYLGTVEKNQDPEKLGRIKVRVPLVHGVSGGTAGYISVDDLPWAYPMGLPSGGSALSGGCSWLPEPGDQVAVQFLDGEPENPVWSWFMQTIDQAKSFKLHSYAGSPGPVGKPDRSVWTRYGHAIEWNAAGLIATTQHGYRLVLTDGDAEDGEVMLSTAAGQHLNLDDETSSGRLNISEDFYAIIGQQFNLVCENARVETTTGDLQMIVGDSLAASVEGTVDVTALDSINVETSANLSLTAEGTAALSSTGPMTLDFSLLSLKTGSTEPFVLGIQLLEFLNTLLLYLATHVHGNGNEGSPTTPPMIPPEAVIQPQPELLVSHVIFGQ